MIKTREAPKQHRPNRNKKARIPALRPEIPRAEPPPDLPPDLLDPPPDLLDPPPAPPVLPPGPPVPGPRQKKPPARELLWPRVFFATTAGPRWSAVRIAAPNADGTFPLSAAPNAALPENRKNFPKVVLSAVTAPRSRIKRSPGGTLSHHLFQGRENFPSGCMLWRYSDWPWLG